MTLAVIVPIGLFFVGMGCVGLFAPERIGAIFGTTLATAEGRNEFRAVYGGFGVAIGALLLAAPALPALRSGIVLCTAVALGGMAGGRVISAAIERPRSFYPAWFYCVLETVMAVGLLWAA